MDLFESDHLIYRAWDSAKDADFFHTCNSDPSVYLNGSKSLPVPSTKKTSEFIIKMCEEGLLFVVVCKKPQPPSGGALQDDEAPEPEPEPIGILAVKSISANLAHNRCGEMGIQLKRDAQGQGYGTEAMRWVLGWAFRVANLHRVQLQVFEWNEMAQRVYKKVGFREEGRLREAIWRDGRWWDEIYMGVLEREWKSDQ